MNEKPAAEQQIREAMARFLGELAPASPAQWQFRPSPTQWSMADVAEHVAIANRNIHQRLSERLLDSPVAGRALGVIDVEIPFLFYRGDEPPNIATPTGALADPGAAREALDAGARAILQWADGVDADLRAVGLPHPVFGLLDGVQWLLFAGAHVERHRAQIIGLKRHREFPA